MIMIVTVMMAVTVIVAVAVVMWTASIVRPSGDRSEADRGTQDHCREEFFDHVHSPLCRVHG